MYQTVKYKSAFVASLTAPGGLNCTIKALLSFFISLLLSTSATAQDSTIIKSPNLQTLFTGRQVTKLPNQLTKKQVANRVKIIAGVNIIGYGAAMAALYSAWYSNYPQSNFHVFNDLGEWKGMDKIGHAYSVYAESKASMELWRWTGIERKKRIWLGGLSGIFYHTAIEVLDGFSAAWGWSWGDIGANFIGSGMFVAQELAWDEQRIQFKFSFHRKTYNDPSLNKQSDKIFGKSTAERFLKDYNGQTYWLSFNLKSFFPKFKIPAWLQISIGTGAEGMFGASENTGKDANGNIIFSRPDIKRYRQWYLSPDIDFTKIKTKHKGLKLLFSLVNVVKFPFPSVEFSNGQFKFNAIGF